MEPQVEAEFYKRDAYRSKKQFISYWYQIDLIQGLEPKKVLEIGIGSGFASSFLRESGVDIATMDIDERLNPDIVGNVLDIPSKDGSYDVVACYEVLEHLPYDRFREALMEIFRVSNRYVVLSLPDASWYVSFYLNLPRIGVKRIMLTLPRLLHQVHHFDGLHYWEIGKAGYELKKVMNDIRGIGFVVNRTFRVFERPRHRFFVLEKPDKPT